MRSASSIERPMLRKQRVSIIQKRIVTDAHPLFLRTACGCLAYMRVQKR